MLVWRIAREIHGDTTLEGIGGLLVAGRWHRRGQPILYTSSSAALAALELLVHVEPLQAPDDLRLQGLELPVDLAIEALDLTQLPDNWQSLPAPESTQSIGSAWLERKSSPRHPKMARVRISSNEAFRFDSRLR
jgi:RES domain-containing protein